MYRFARSALLTGNPAKATEWAVTIAEKVNQISEMPVQLWSSVLSSPLGLTIWTATVDSVSEIEATDAKLAVDSGFLDLQAAGADYIVPGSPGDSLSTIVFATPGAEQGNFHYASATTAQVLPGQFRRGVELGIEFAQKGHSLCGLATTFETGVTGAMGTVTWAIAADSLEQLQRGEDAINTDESFLAKIDTEGSKTYQPTATVSYFRRLL